MKEFVSIDEVENKLDIIAQKIPKEFYDELNLGILLVEDLKLHPKSINNTLYVLGEYQRSRAGSQIIIYYGSLKKCYSTITESQLDEKLEELLLHEFTHHIEFRAGENGLVVKDEEALEEYLKTRKAQD